MSGDSQNRSETTLTTKVVDENGKEVELEGDHFTPYQFKPLVVSAWKLPYMVQVTTPDVDMVGDIGDWLVVAQDNNVYICKSDVFDLHYSPIPDKIPEDISPDEEAARAAVQSETQLSESGDPPIFQWTVTLRCEIPFKPDVLLPAWQTRLPNVPISVDFNASTENKSVFDVVVGIRASSNAGACSMASGLLKRHFQTIEILDMGAGQA